MRTLMSGRLSRLAWHEQVSCGRVSTAEPHRTSPFSLVNSRQASLRMPLRHVVVAGAFLLQWTLGRAAEPQFWLFHVAVALTAVYGRAEATLVAILLSVLLARLSSAVPMSTALLFGIEGLLIGLVVLRMTKVIQELRRSLEGSVRELESAEGQAYPPRPCAEPPRPGTGRHGGDLPRPRRTRQRLADRCDTPVRFRRAPRW